jgi:hypothetical protein
LLHPCASNRRTSSSRGVILMASKSIMSATPDWLRTAFQKHEFRQTFAHAVR